MGEKVVKQVGLSSAVKRRRVKSLPRKSVKECFFTKCPYNLVKYFLIPCKCSCPRENTREKSLSSSGSTIPAGVLNIVKEVSDFKNEGYKYFEVESGNYKILR